MADSNSIPSSTYVDNSDGRALASIDRLNELALELDSFVKVLDVGEEPPPIVFLLGGMVRRLLVASSDVEQCLRQRVSVERAFHGAPGASA